MSSLSGLRLALCAGIVVALTWLAYRARGAQAPRTTMYRGAMAGAAVLALLAVFNSPGFVGGSVAIIALAAAAVFVASK